jgi:chromosome segregation ATPase
LGTATAAADDRGGPLSQRRRASLEALQAEASEQIEIELAGKLDEARASVALLEGRLSVETTTARALRERLQTSLEAADAAEQRAADLDIRLGAVRRELEEKIDLVTAENARLSDGFAERGIALDDAQARIKFLEIALATAEAEAAAKRPERLENAAASNRLQEKLDLVNAENACLSQSAAAADAALGDAQARIEFLEAALSAAEAECSRLTTELGDVCEKRQAESETLSALSARAVTAEKLLAETRERLLARIVETDAVRQRMAAAKAAGDEAYAKSRQLEDALCLRQCEVEELEQSRSTLAKAAKTLLQTFQHRDRALIRAEETIKVLADRNARLEAGAKHEARPKQETRAKHEPAASRAHGPAANEGLDIPQPPADAVDDTKRKDLVELARLLSDFTERKRQSAAPGEMRSMTVLAGTITF